MAADPGNKGLLTRAVLALSGCADALAHARDEDDLLERVCSMLVETSGYRLAWIGMREDDPERSVRVGACAGRGIDYLADIRITRGEGPHGRGPTGTAIRTGRTATARHIPTDPAFAPWREQALERGYASSLAAPMRDGDEVLGALNVYAAEPDAFDAGEIKLLERMAASVAAGITAIRARARIAAYHELLRAVWDATPDYLLLHDAHGEILEVNQRVLDDAGLSREELLANQHLINGIGKDLEEARAQVCWVVRNKAPRDLERVGRRRDGSDFPTEVRLRPLALQAEDGPRVLALVRDISDRRRIERERMDIERMESLSALAGGIAHDFNNLLCGLLGNIELARMAESDEDRELSLAEAEEATMGATSLTRQLLTFARGTSSMPAVIHLGDVLRETALFACRGSPVAIGIDIAADLWPVLADEGQIAQVVQNLVLNAVQANARWWEGAAPGSERRARRSAVQPELRPRLCPHPLRRRGPRHPRGAPAAGLRPLGHDESRRQRSRLGDLVFDRAPPRRSPAGGQSTGRRRGLRDLPATRPGSGGGGRGAGPRGRRGGAAASPGDG